jgi:hypothetical protein
MTERRVNVAPPRLINAPNQYDRAYQDQLNNVLRLYFNEVGAQRDWAVLGLSIAVDRMPTQADVADLRVGDVYRDTSAGNVLKVKV